MGAERNWVRGTCFHVGVEKVEGVAWGMRRA